MTYYPGEKWSNMLFSIGEYDRFPTEKNNVLNEKDSYDLLLKLARNNLGGHNATTQVSFGPDYDEYLLELSKQHGIFLLTNPKYKDNENLGDNLIVVPMFTKHNKQKFRSEPTDVWIIDLDNQTYDGIPLTDDYNGSVYDIYRLSKRFISEVGGWLQEYYQEKIGYDAINKRRVL